MGPLRIESTVKLNVSVDSVTSQVSERIAVHDPTLLTSTSKNLQRNNEGNEFISECMTNVVVLHTMII